MLLYSIVLPFSCTCFLYLCSFCICCFLHVSFIFYTCYVLRVLMLCCQVNSTNDITLGLVKWNGGQTCDPWAACSPQKHFVRLQSSHTCIDSRDKPIYQPSRYKRPIFGFCQYIGIGQNRLSRCWQNAIIFLMHPDNLLKKAQQSKSKQLSCNNVSRCVFINEQTS